MRSPIPCPSPRVIRQSPQKHDEDTITTASISSQITTMSSSRKSLLPQKTSLSYFGFGNEANIRVVARIRPATDVNSTTASNSKNDKVCVFAVKNDALQDVQVSFLSPSKSNSVRNSPSNLLAPPQHSSTSTSPAANTTVSGLTAMFDSPNNKPLMPSTDACTTLASPSKLFSPSQGTTPLRSNGGGGGNMKMISSVKRQSFIPTPTPSKEIEEKIDKRMAFQFQTSHGIVAGDEKFHFDAVSYYPLPLTQER